MSRTQLLPFWCVDSLFRADDRKFCACVRVAFFANDFIPANTELCYDYGYFQGNVAGKHRECLCGADNCRKVLY